MRASWDLFGYFVGADYRFCEVPDEQRVELASHGLRASERSPAFRLGESCCRRYPFAWKSEFGDRVLKGLSHSLEMLFGVVPSIIQLISEFLESVVNQGKQAAEVGFANAEYVSVRNTLNVEYGQEEILPVYLAVFAFVACSAAHDGVADVNRRDSVSIEETRNRILFQQIRPRTVPLLESIHFAHNRLHRKSDGSAGGGKRIGQALNREKVKCRGFDFVEKEVSLLDLVLDDAYRPGHMLILG